jgi:IS5 family transposase
VADEPLLRVESREELVWLLAQASELERGLTCGYLSAQFTLSRTAGLGHLAELATDLRGMARDVQDA